MKLIPDDELERLAGEHAPNSHQAVMLADLRGRRANDEQVHCFQLGEFLVVCPMPTAQQEVQLKRVYEASKQLQSSKPTNIADIIAALGEAEQTQSIGWICARCAEVIVSDEPVTAPPTCMFCGSKLFAKV